MYLLYGHRWWGIWAVGRCSTSMKLNSNLGLDAQPVLMFTVNTSQWINNICLELEQNWRLREQSFDMTSCNHSWLSGTTVALANEAQLSSY